MPRELSCALLSFPEVRQVVKWEIPTSLVELSFFSARFYLRDLGRPLCQSLINKNVSQME